MKYLFLAHLCVLFPFFCMAKEAPAFSPPPVAFIENKGQVIDQYYKSRKDIDFRLSAGPGLNVFIGNGALHYQFSQVPDLSRPGPKSAHDGTKHAPLNMYRMDVELVGANTQAPFVTGSKLQGCDNYYTPGTGPDGAIVYSYSSVTYKDIYPGIDWVLFMDNGQLKHQFVLKPGARVSDIKLKYSGATSLRLLPGGTLQAVTPQGNISEQAPYSYGDNGQKVESSFMLSGNVLSYSTAAYTGTLVIDPVITWATYYGASLIENLSSASQDPAGNILMAGLTTSTSNIATVGTYQTVFGGGFEDGMVVKFNSAGIRQWATYYGGSDDDIAYGVGADASNNVYVGGQTNSTAGIATAGSYQASYGGGFDDAFIVKLNSSGVRQWATYYGGSDVDQGYCLTVDGTNNVYIAGQTFSTSGISTAGSQQPAHGGNTDGFLVKFNSAGARQWGTYYGGGSNDLSYSLAHDGSGNIIMAGTSTSSTGISTPGSYQATNAGGQDAFIVKFNGSGARQWGTYFGGPPNEDMFYNCVATDAAGNIYLTGSTFSLTAIASPGAYQPTFGGGTSDAFLAAFNSAGARQWSTYLGGTVDDHGSCVVADNSGNVIFGGYTASTTGIAIAGALQPALAGNTDGYLAAFNSTTGTIQWSTYYGGAGLDDIQALVTDGANNLYVAGDMQSLGMATAGAFQTVYAGQTDFMLTKLCYQGGAGTLSGPPSVCVSSNITLTPSVAGGTWSASNGHATVAAGVVTGVSAGTDTITYSVSYPCGVSIVSKIIEVGSYAGTLSGADSVCSGLAIPLTASIAGGTWSVTNNKAMISGTGVVTGLYVGTDTVLYTVTTACGPAVASKVIIINPLPTPIIVATGAVLSTTLPYTSYQWLLAGNPIAGATNPTYTATTNGAYSVKVYNNHGCTATSAVKTLTNVGIGTLNPTSAYINVYPNPVQDVLQISYSNIDNGRIDILDMLGKILISQKLLSAVNVKDLAIGIYMYRISNDSGIIAQGKIIKE